MRPLPVEKGGYREIEDVRAMMKKRIDIARFPLCVELLGRPSI